LFAAQVAAALDLTQWAEMQSATAA